METLRMALMMTMGVIMVTTMYMTMMYYMMDE